MVRILRQFARKVAFSGLMVIMVTGASATARAEEESAVASQPMIGAAAPDFTLKQINDTTLSLGDLTGKYVVIHFGASW
jgi:cytochrome oxidase Cu insertion factor (SCO1/SenC/PrrC family)